MMIMTFAPMPKVHQLVRQTWRRQVLPAITRRDTIGLLAALVLADTSLDEVLIAEGYVGDTTGERVDHASDSFSNYHALLEARRIRHAAVHHLDYHLSQQAGGGALAAYAQALWDHGVNLCDIHPLSIDGTV